MSHYFLVSAVTVRLFLLLVVLLFFRGFFVFFCFFVFLTLGHRIADPVTGCSPTIPVYIRLTNTATAVYFQPA